MNYNRELQTRLDDMAGLVIDPRNKESLAIKQVVIFLLVEGPPLIYEAQ